MARAQPAATSSADALGDTTLTGYDTLGCAVAVTDADQQPTTRLIPDCGTTSYCSGRHRPFLAYNEVLNMSYGIHVALEEGHDNLEPPLRWTSLALDVRAEYSDRVVFSLLARDDSLHEVEPVGEPRGLPSDASLALKNWYASWGNRPYDTSWVTYDEFAATLQRIEAKYRETDVFKPEVARHLHVGASVQAIEAFLRV